MSTPLRVGDLSAELIGTDLWGVTWRGREVLHRLFARARDDAWGTPRAVCTSTRWSQGEGIAIEQHSDASASGLPVRWTTRYELSDSGLVADLTATALARARVNRLGWCLLHPLSHVGGAVDVSLAGRERRFRFPSLLEPQPLASDGPRPAWGPFDELRVSVGDVALLAEFEGDLFETEDQRNWTDASFKTYSTPLALPRPHVLEEGQRLHQRVTCRFKQSVRADAHDVEPIACRPGATTWSVLLDSDCAEADLDAALTAVDAVRVRVRGDEATSAHHLVARARASGRAWELELVCGRVVDWDGFRRLLADPRAPEVIIVVPDGPSGSATETTSGALMQAAATELGRAHLLGGGTLHNPCELLRHDVTQLAVASFTYSPLVHDDDERSIGETLCTYPAVVASVRAASRGAEVSVGPLRDADRLTPEWVGRSLSAWRDAGADRICVARASEVAQGGRLNALGRAVRGAHDSR